MKMKIKITIPKPRNLLVPELFKLKSGSHQKSEKSLRRKANIQIKNSNIKEFDK